MQGSTFRRCGCRDQQTGKQLGRACPKLTQRRHGTWGWRQEIPADEGGKRRTLRRSGFDTKTDAQAELDKIRALLDIADDGDSEGQREIAETLIKAVAEGQPLPDFDEAKRKFRTGVSLVRELTVGDWLDQWLAGLRIRKSGIARYEVDIRCHLKPHLGHHQLGRLRISHISAMFAAIDEANEATAAANTVRRQVDERRRDTWAGKAGRAEQLAVVAEMRSLPPFKRPTGLATQ